MNFNQLKIFYFSAKYGSFSAAAEALFISQPAVTKQIQQLQSTYEIKFFNRIGKRMVLTDAGEALYDMANKIFQIEIQAEEKIRDFQQRRGGRIRIHSSESFGAYYLPFILHPFQKRYPKFFVSVNILPDEQVVENTLKLENDLGFISSFLEYKKLVVREVVEDRLVLIVPPNHPFSRRKRVSLHSLEGQPFINHEKGSATRTIVDDLVEKNGLSVSISLELSNNEAIKRAVEKGMGISIISENVVREEVRRKKLRKILLADQSSKRKFYMIHHKDKYISQPLVILMDMVYQWASKYAQAHA